MEPSPPRISPATRRECEEAARVRVGPAPKFEPIPGTEFTLDADLVLLAMGFTGPVKAGLVDKLGVTLDQRGNVATDDRLHDFRARRVRGGRRAARAIAGGVGHRGRPQSRRGGGSIPAGVAQRGDRRHFRTSIVSVLATVSGNVVCPLLGVSASSAIRCCGKRSRPAIRRCATTSCGRTPACARSPSAASSRSSRCCTTAAVPRIRACSTRRFPRLFADYAAATARRFPCCGSPVGRRSTNRSRRRASRPCTAVWYPNGYADHAAFGQSDR